ncbi:class I SAM-dependent methyltransferase [Pseudomonas sp. CR3202]|uniref:class I SAM-dependent methyltransferase n=1 Tax=Pseudomonas sp. CR3202 TaxID=3351532 RepID=UPI003BF327A1
MTCPQPLLRLAPITSGLVLRNPRILLGGSHQPTLLRYLEGWPKRLGRQRNFLIQFAREGESLARFVSDGFDMAVIQAPSAEDLPEVVGQLVRVARQGLITRR